eukprot:m.143052 g.143052  ORF g.143052 m.143052 type:complete len:56 (+) comp30287_c2_seq1:72-239(+)
MRRKNERKKERETLKEQKRGIAQKKSKEIKCRFNIDSKMTMFVQDKPIFCSKTKQ